MKKAALVFEDLETWQEARSIVKQIYALCRGGRIARDFGLTGQLQRAGVSVMSNVAEGFERSHIPEKLQFYNVARASIGEVRSLLYVVEDNYPDHAESARNLRDDVNRIGRLASGLIASTEARRLTRVVAAAAAIAGVAVLMVL